MTPLEMIRLEEAASTQDEARRRHQGPPILVVAGRQTAGRGRTGASWETAPRAIAASLAFASDWPADAAPRITLVAGLAAAATLGVDLKWPNDLVTGSGKVGGILTERSDAVVVVGMGVNLWWPSPPEGVAAIADHDPGEEAAPALAAVWAGALLDRLRRGPEDWGRGEYLDRCVTLGRAVTWEPAGAGTAIDVTDAGALVIRTRSGTVVLDSGEVRLVRPATPPPSLA